VEAEAEAVVKKRKRKKEIDEEGFEVGRYLGVIARRDPELYERLKNYAEASGSKFTDIVYEALTLYDEYVQLSAVDARSLLVALRLLDHLFKRLLQMMMTLNQFFTTEFFQQQINIMHELQQQRTQQLQAIKQEAERSKQNEVKARLIEMTMNVVMNLLQTMMQGIMTMTIKPQAKSPQVTTPISAPISTSKVKVVRSAKSSE